MKTKTENILSFMKILALLGGIGFSFECGAHLVVFIACLINPELSGKMYPVQPDLFRLYGHSVYYYISANSFVIVLSALKAFVWYFLLDLLLKLKIQEPFSRNVARKLEILAILLLGIWSVGAFGNEYIHWLAKKTGESLNSMGVSGEYFFMAGILYIVSQIFKRGIEIQEENQLTV